MWKKNIKTELLIIAFVPFLLWEQVAFVITWGLEVCIMWVGESYKRIKGRSEK